MTVTIDIFPLSSTIDMLGAPDESSAYSVSGHVSISLISTASLFERRRAIRLLLQSLVITFEGQSELVTPETGYSGVRLCSVSQELAPADPMELSNEGHEDSDKPVTWNVVFNVPIPGWLPPTDVFGDCHESPPGTRYTLTAAAKFAHANEPSASYSWLSTLCSPFQFRSKQIHSLAREIVLNRFAVPPASTPLSSPSSYPLCNYSISSIVSTGTKKNGSPIPTDVLSKLQVIATVPEHVSVTDSSMPFTLRLRAADLSNEDASRLSITHFSIELEQVEKHRSTAAAYAAKYPLPRERAQPPNKPLRDPHPVQALYEVGLLVLPQSRHHSIEITSSLLPGCLMAQYPLDGTGHIFDHSDDLDGEQWYTMQTDIPFVHQLPEVERFGGWMANPRLRPTGQSPFFVVKHLMQITIACSYQGAEGGPLATDDLRFSVPISFVRLRPTPMVLPVRVDSLQTTASQSSALSITMPLSLPYSAPDLPAYSQLYYSNGDRKVDYTVPLPLYTPSANSSESSLSREGSEEQKADGL
ncbi:hypothetical protein FA95DRAFT_9337 [Auriscalpium vulgare]|uniref:Uncharacterized protein n=1 Tax=Auriscalpium vulgare TaxID=40419 RepID=A0ACB8SD95_9AGAM|nr:hypothetical protein FA95DRAFT_9337 [Auriscalpium vulgare]